MKKTKIPDSVICDTLRSAIEKNTPDVLDSVIADIDKSAVCEEVNLTETDRSLILNNRFRRIAAVAAAIVLIVTGVVGAYLLSGKTESLITVTIEVNPEIELTVTRDGDVASMTALNDDGSALLDEESVYVGTECKTAVLAIVDLLIEEEYLQPHNASVLISVSGGSRDRRESLSLMLEESVSYHLSDAGLKGTVLLRTFDGKGSVATEIAERHSISMGKAQLVSEIMSKSPIYTELELSRLSIQELGEILESLDPDKNKVVPVLGEVISFTPRKDADKGDPEFTPTILPEFDSDKDITKDEAKELVLAHSGAKDFPVQNYSCQKYSGGEVPVYNISFICDRYEFSYTVQIRGGVILDSEKTERETVNTLKGMTYTEGESENSIPFLVTHFYGEWSSTFDVITSKKEFYTAFPNPFPDVSYDRGTEFIGEMCRLRDSFFDEYTLLLYTTPAGSSSVSYSVPDVTLEDGTITAFIDIYHPQWQNSDFVSYIYVIAVRNEDIGDSASAVTSITSEYDDGVEEPPFGEEHPIHIGSDGTEYMMRHYNYLLGSIDPYFSFDYKKYALNRDSITDSNRPVLIFTSKEETRTFIEELEKEFTQNYSMGRYLPHDMLSLSDDFYDDYTLLLLYLTQTGNRKFIDNIVTDVTVENSTLTISLDRSFSGWGTEKKFVTMILVAVKNDDLLDFTTAKTVTNDIEKSPLNPPGVTTEPVTTEPDLTDDVTTNIPTEITTEPPVVVVPPEITETPPVTTEPPVTVPPVTAEPPVTEPPVTEPPVTEPPVTEPPVTGIQPQPITKPDEAKATALAHAKVDGKLILGYYCEENRSGDTYTYKIGFTCGGYEYRYTVAMGSGKILASEKKRVDYDLRENLTEYAASAEYPGAIPYRSNTYSTSYSLVPEYMYKGEDFPGALLLTSRKDVDAYLARMQDFVDEIENPSSSVISFAYDLDTVTDEFFKTYTVMVVHVVEHNVIPNTLKGVSVTGNTLTAHIDRFLPSTQQFVAIGSVTVIVLKNTDIPGVTKAEKSVVTTEEHEAITSNPFYFYETVSPSKNCFGYKVLKCWDSVNLTNSEYESFNISTFAENKDITELHPAIVKFDTKAELDAFLEAAYTVFPGYSSSSSSTPKNFISNLEFIPEEHFEENSILFLYLIDTNGSYKTVYDNITPIVDGSSFTIEVERTEEYQWPPQAHQYHANIQFIFSVAKSDLAGITSFDTYTALFEIESIWD